MADPKWADVANYYLKSGIYGMASLNGSKRDPLYMPMGSRDIEDFPPRVFVPILRHRDDMTESEAREWFKIEEGKDWPENGYFEHKTAKDRWMFFSTVIRQSSLGTSNQTYSANEFIWLVSRGFDLFGLI